MAKFEDAGLIIGAFVGIVVGTALLLPTLSILNTASVSGGDEVTRLLAVVSIMIILLIMAIPLIPLTKQFREGN